MPAAPVKAKNSISMQLALARGNEVNKTMALTQSFTVMIKKKNNVEHCSGIITACGHH